MEILGPVEWFALALSIGIAGLIFVSNAVIISSFSVTKWREFTWAYIENFYEASMAAYAFFAFVVFLHPAISFWAIGVQRLAQVATDPGTVLPGLAYIFKDAPVMSGGEWNTCMWMLVVIFVLLSFWTVGYYVWFNWAWTCFHTLVIAVLSWIVVYILGTNYQSDYDTLVPFVLMLIFAVVTTVIFIYAVMLYRDGPLYNVMRVSFWAPYHNPKFFARSFPVPFARFMRKRRTTAERTYNFEQSVEISENTEFSDDIEATTASGKSQRLDEEQLNPYATQGYSGKRKPSKNKK